MAECFLNRQRRENKMEEVLSVAEGSWNKEANLMRFCKVARQVER